MKSTLSVSQKEVNCGMMFYTLPLNEVLTMVVSGILLWICLGIVFSTEKNEQYKIWKYLNVFLCIVAVGLIIKFTLWGRFPGIRELQLFPFSELMSKKNNDEAVRTMVMNVVLFLPFGLTLPYVIDVIKSNYRKWLFCIVLGFLMSVCIETIQYLFALGRTETDDVICNTFGCALGILADTIVEGMRKRWHG